MILAEITLEIYKYKLMREKKYNTDEIKNYFNNYYGLYTPLKHLVLLNK